MWQKFKNFFHYLNASVAACYYNFPAYKLKVIGVTGTDGKTTTSTLIYRMLISQKLRAGLISTVAAYLGENQIDTGFHVTSPNPWSLQKLLSQMVKHKYTHVVLEATSHGLDQFRLLHTNVSVGVLTNITHEHLDYHKNYSNYVYAKSKLFHQVELAIINADDHQSFNSILRYISSPIEAYTLSEDNYHSSQFTLISKAKIIAAAKKRFPEIYNQSNTLAAATAATFVGVSLESIVHAIDTFPGVPGRMEVVSDHPCKIIVDFAHTPNALKSVLTAAKNQTKGKLIVVFGAAGLRDFSKRPLMGMYASDFADEIILTSEDPRTENPMKIIEQIKSGVKINPNHVYSIVDRHEAIAYAIKIASKSDWIIICGKGHEKSMNLDGKHEIPWSDQDEVKKILLQKD